jgi:eukaryotic-like serine/threonine-protein kinase
LRPEPKQNETDVPPLEAGTLIGGRYRVLGLIGEGGMARVYEVEHAELGRRFALKLLHPRLVHERAQVERFQQEARAVARLDSPQIVGTVDCGVTEGGCPFFVMELLRGSDLRQLVTEEAPLSAVRTIHLALDVCRGLAVAHAAGIVHRDLKPENLFVTRDSEGKEQCKLLDFGIAKLMEGNPTLPGTLMGTIRYMAPEQLGEQPIGPCTDLFALGVTLFECLTGTPPFEADTFERVLFKIVNHPAPDLLALRPDLEPPLAELVMRLLAKNPKDRPVSALALADDLGRCLTKERRAAADSSLAYEPTRETSVLPVPSSLPNPSSLPLRENGAARRAILMVAATLALGALGAWGAAAWRGAAAANAVTRATSTTSTQTPPSTTPTTVTPPTALTTPIAPTGPTGPTTVTATAPTATAAPARATAPSSATATASRRVRIPPPASAGSSAPNAPRSEPDLPLFYPRRANASDSRSAPP